MSDRKQKAKERTDRFIEAWRQGRIEEGKRIGRTPCLNPTHKYVENHPELLYSSPHLHRDFGNCDGWLDDVGEGHDG